MINFGVGLMDPSSLGVDKEAATGKVGRPNQPNMRDIISGLYCASAGPRGTGRETERLREQWHFGACQRIPR